MLVNVIKETTLKGAETGAVRRLQGFIKSRHKEPDRLSDAAERFICNVGHDNVKQHAEQIYGKVTKAFGYKRKDVSYDCEDAQATIKTPDFDVTITIKQDEDDPGGYVITTEVGVFRRPQVIGETPFLDTFSSTCDRVVIDLARPIEIYNTIDAIEENEELAKHLEYAPNGDWLTLSLPQTQIVMHVTATTITCTRQKGGDLKLLLKGTAASFALLGAAKATLC